MKGTYTNREQALAANGMIGPNPLIGKSAGDTIENILPLITLIQEMCSDPDEERLDKKRITGLHSLSGLIKATLDSELKLKQMEFIVDSRAFSSAFVVPVGSDQWIEMGRHDSHHETGKKS